MEIHRAESLNDSPVFIKTLADIVSQHLKDYSSGRVGPTSIQLGLRCPGLYERDMRAAEVVVGEGRAVVGDMGRRSLFLLFSHFLLESHLH